MQTVRLTPPLFEDSAEPAILRLAVDLGAASGNQVLSPAERDLVAAALAQPPSDALLLEATRAGILNGADPLGALLCRVRPAGQRRSIGAFYTPPVLVDSMVDWVLARRPDRLVDAGCGSGRFAAAVVRRVPDLAVYAIDIDPVATVITRATLAVLGARRATVQHADYTTWQLPEGSGRAAFIGNPPYVRHHDLSPSAKAWAIEAGRRLGHKVSGLAGLHAHFYLATMLLARPGDVGCFVTSAEWLDVGYGAALRALFLDGLGGQALHVVDPQAVTFEGVQATAVVACFELGAGAAPVHLRAVYSAAAMRDLDLGRPVPRAMLAASPRWSGLARETETVVSNSEVNSFKRLNHEVGNKAASWTRAFGQGIVPAAVLDGVFKLDNLERAQAAGITIFWERDLQPLSEFVLAAR
jgi:adenine-specific DNA-methyltransferase